MHFALKDTTSLRDKAPKHSQVSAPINKVTYFAVVMHSTVGWGATENPFARSSIEACVVSTCKCPPTPLVAAML